ECNYKGDDEKCNPNIVEYHSVLLCVVCAKIQKRQQTSKIYQACLNILQRVQSVFELWLKNPNEQDISSLLEYFTASAVRFRALAQKPKRARYIKLA
ncbi:MAG: hypothetical protein IIU97_01475, partial [Bacteroidaceae bacterium]|nr:hypothetical protein [Bacteroidaceae bacterium]